MHKFDFVTIDFETATGSYNSACAIGIAAVKDMQIVDTFYSLIKPPNNDFDQQTIKIHGITPDAVADAPTASVLWDTIKRYFDCPIVAHNAYFDMAVLEKSFVESSNLKQYYADSMSFSRYMGFSKHSLVACAEHFNIGIGTHHNALDDAVTCANISIKTLKFFECTSLWQFLALNRAIPIYTFPVKAAEGYTIGKKQANQKHKKFETIRIADIAPSAEAAVCNSPLHGCNIVFTGELSIGRQQAMQLAVDAGAILKSTVSRKTHYLVVGTQDKSIVGESGLSQKEEKAHELILQEGVGIKILNEEAFLKLAKGEVLI